MAAVRHGDLDETALRWVLVVTHDTSDAASRRQFLDACSCQGERAAVGQATPLAGVLESDPPALPLGQRPTVPDHDAGHRFLPPAGSDRPPDAAGTHADG